MRQNKLAARFAAGCVSLLLVCSLLAVAAMAAVSDGYRMIFTGDSSAGGELHLSMEMTGVESFGALELLITYNADQLTLTDHDKGSALSGVLAVSNGNVAGEVRISAITVEDVTPNGEIYYMDFTVNSGVSAGDEISVSLLVRDSMQNDKTVGSTRGLLLTSTIAAGETADKDDPDGISQQETTSRAPESELAGNRGSTASSGSTGGEINASDATAEDASGVTGSGQQGGSTVNDGETSGWLLPAALVLGIALLAAILVIFTRPKAKKEPKVEYVYDPDPPALEETPSVPSEEASTDKTDPPQA